MSRLPIRLRLTLAFAAATLLVLAAAGTFVYVEVRDELGEQILAQDDRDDVLTGLITTFVIAGPVAVLLASLLGYLLAGVALKPVEAMRARAAEVSLAAGGDRLPLPAARDEIRRLGETLNDMLDRLSRSFERERRFVADASHELRTPVAVLKTELEGALRAGEHAPEVRTALVAAVEECDHLAQLAEDLLVLARAGEGRLPVRPEPLAVAALLEGVRDRFTDRAGQRGRDIRVAAAGDLEVAADPLRLRQALGNLVDNALRHGAGAVTLGARPADEGALLWVRDEGAGVRDPALFERFATGDAARSRSEAGAGGAGDPVGRGGGGTGL
ncbi:MAG TPA: histidine kinase dimerization/phospho-acceptor domain-containing protein, partial [Solirubrobacteraceae bacterium]|nr:histidine kinase dimerization/phospho-acceptor domain-containing protein [Solirubrobacteraceae bacterium]